MVTFTGEIINGKLHFSCSDCLTSHFVSAFIGTGYLLFGRNDLVIFILVSVFYVFSGFIFLRIFSAFFTNISAFSPCVAADFRALFLLVSWHLFVAACLFFCILFAVFLHKPLLSFCSFFLVKVVCYFLEI